MARITEEFTPYFQTKLFTCGPSCIIMARSAFGEEISYNAKEEMAVWERTKTNKGSLVHTTHPRMASFLMRKGYKTELWHTHPQGFTYSRCMNYWVFHKKMKYYDLYRKIAEAEGMVIKIRYFTAREITDRLMSGESAAILLTEFERGNPMLHHVLAYGATQDLIKIACPLRGKYAATLEQINSMITLPFGKGALIIEKEVQHGKEKKTV